MWTRKSLVNERKSLVNEESLVNEDEGDRRSVDRRCFAAAAAAAISLSSIADAPPAVDVDQSTTVVAGIAGAIDPTEHENYDELINRRSNRRC